MRGIRPTIEVRSIPTVKMRGIRPTVKMRGVGEDGRAREGGRGGDGEGAVGEEVLLVVVVAGEEGESAERRLRGRKEGRGGVGAQGRQFGEERAGAQGGEVVVRVKRVGERLVAKIGRIVRIDGRGLIERVERWLHEGLGRPIPLLRKMHPDGAARRRGRHAEPRR